MPPSAAPYHGRVMPSLVQTCTLAVLLMQTPPRLYCTPLKLPLGSGCSPGTVPRTSRRPCGRLHMQRGSPVGPGCWLSLHSAPSPLLELPFALFMLLHGGRKAGVLKRPTSSACWLEHEHAPSSLCSVQQQSLPSLGDGRGSCQLPQPDPLLPACSAFLADLQYRQC